MTVTFRPAGMFGTFTMVGHFCDDLCEEYLPAGHETCPGEYVETGHNASNANAGALLRVLDLVDPADTAEDLVGSTSAEDFLARVDLALVVRVDVTRPTVTTLPGSDRPGYGAAEVSFGLSDADVVRHLHALREVAVQAMSLDLPVDWC